MPHARLLPLIVPLVQGLISKTTLANQHVLQGIMKDRIIHANYAIRHVALALLVAQQIVILALRVIIFPLRQQVVA